MSAVHTHIYKYHRYTCYGVSATLFDVGRTLLLAFVRPFLVRRALDVAARFRQHGPRLRHLLVRPQRRLVVDAGVLGHRHAVAVQRPGRGPGRRHAARRFAQLVRFE